MRILNLSCQAMIAVAVLFLNARANTQIVHAAQERMHQANEGISTAELRDGKCMPGNQIAWSCFDQPPCLCPIPLKGSTAVPECRPLSGSSSQLKICPICPGEVCRCLVQPGFSPIFPECVPLSDKGVRPGFCLAGSSSGSPGGACPCIPMHPIY
jgi:hypothetical protein